MLLFWLMLLDGKSPYSRDGGGKGKILPSSQGGNIILPSSSSHHGGHQHYGDSGVQDGLGNLPCYCN